MKTRLSIVVLLFAMATSPAGAHEDGVYESLGHIPIGRIFLTPEARASLDKMRGKEPLRSSNPRPVADDRDPVTSNEAAGFIVSDSGTTRVWRNGDFVATASASGVRFPGQVRIASQPVPEDGDDNGGTDETAEPSVGARDDEE